MGILCQPETDPIFSGKLLLDPKLKYLAQIRTFLCKVRVEFWVVSNFDTPTLVSYS